MNFFEFLQKANSEQDGTPSQTRTIGTVTAVLFDVVLAAGFLYCLRWYPQFIIEYALILIVLVASLAGIKTYQTVKRSGQ